MEEEETSVLLESLVVKVFLPGELDGNVEAEDKLEKEFLTCPDCITKEFILAPVTA